MIENSDDRIKISRMILSVVVFLLLHNIMMAQQWEVPIYVTDRADELKLLRLGIGFHPEATDGNDGFPLDSIAPPPPPSGNFDARIDNPASADDFFTDTRKSSTSQIAFDIKYQPASGQGPILLNWDSEQLSGLGAFEIVDNITGVLYGPLDMTTTNSLDVSTAGGLLDAGLRILVTSNPTSIEKDNLNLPDEKSFILYPNFPNPFNGGTTIKFYINKNSYVDLSIYNIIGQKINTLVSGNKNTGLYKLRWDGKNDFGSPVPSGVYFARLQGQTDQQFIKLFFIK